MRNKVLPTNINLDSANILTVMVCFFIRAGPPSLAENECKQTTRERWGTGQRQTLHVVGDDKSAYLDLYIHQL